MSDNQGNAPADQTPADAAGGHTPAVAHPAPDTAAAPATSAAPAAPQQPAPPAPTTAAWQAAQQPQSPAAPAHQPPAGYPAHQQAYARPQGYAGQPAAYPQSYAGQQQGAAFGVRPGDTQTTATLGQGPATGTT